ncbi:hypothetical protein [Thalassospira xiamenensis]|nr:hypothetical protein [Thalassospira xiamenensis]
MKLGPISSVRNSSLDDRNIYLSTLLAVVALKVAVLLYWGPGIAPDSGGYMSYGDMIFEDSSWWNDAGLLTGAMPITVFRMMGYPLFIGFLKVLSPNFWMWTVVLCQIALTAVSLVYLSRLIHELKLRPLIGVFCMLSAGFSYSLTLDNMILTDSVVASIFVIILSANAISSLRGEPIKFFQSFLFGALLSISFLFREGVLVLSSLFVIPLVIRVILTKSRHFRSCLAGTVFFAPLLIISQIYIHWNETRTGSRFITTGGQTVYLQGLADAARNDERIFSGQKVIDVTARENFVEFDFSEVLAIQKSLFSQGYEAPELAMISKEKYFQTWAEYPLSMLRMTIGHLRERFALLTFRPLASLRETGFWIKGERPWGDYNVLKSRVFEGLGAFSLFTLESVERFIAIVVTLAFVIIPVVWFVRLCLGKKSNKGEVLVCCSLWSVYFGVMASHALVHIEPRYLAPVLPFSIVVGAFCLQNLVGRKGRQELTS